MCGMGRCRCGCVVWVDVGMDRCGCVVWVGVGVGRCGCVRMRRLEMDNLHVCNCSLPPAVPI